MRTFCFAACALLALAFATPASAQPALAGQLGQCMGIFGAVERLSCYDRVARSVNPQGAPPAQPATVARPYSAAAPAAAAPAYAAAPQYAPPAAFAGVTSGYQTRPEQFGSEYIAPPVTGGSAPPRPLNQIAGTITSVRFTPARRFILTLSNGQVWQQIEGDIAVPMLGGKKVRSVTISRGLLGSYNLVFSDQKGLYKVERLQ